MITINLLSPRKKEEARNHRIYATFKEIAMIFLLFTLVASIMLKGSEFFLENQLTELIVQNSSQITEVEAINQKIKAANIKIKGMEKIQANHQKMSDIIYEIASITPSSVYYNSIKIYRKEGIIELKGTAQTRAQLQLLEKTLNNSEKFENINLPLSNLLSKENNKFTIQADLKL